MFSVFDADMSSATDSGVTARVTQDIDALRLASPNVVADSESDDPEFEVSKTKMFSPSKRTEVLFDAYTFTRLPLLIAPPTAITS